MKTTNKYEETMSIYTGTMNDLLRTMYGNYRPIPKQVIFRNPLTIVNWQDGTKTIVKCMESDVFNKEMGFYACLAKKIYGGHNPYKKFIENAIVQIYIEKQI